MAVNYQVIDYSINAMIEHLMKKYNSSYESAINYVLNSALYKRLLQDSTLREEGDIYLLNQLDKEVNAELDQS